MLQMLCNAQGKRNFWNANWPQYSGVPVVVTGGDEDGNGGNLQERAREVVT